VTAVRLGVDADHAGDVGAFYIAAIEQVLAQIVEFVGEDPASDSDGVVGLFSDCAVQHFGEPPDACLASHLPFLCQLLRTANNERLISTQININKIHKNK
jgi:hypothetical protein